MVVTAFPPLESADEYGLLAVGGDLEVQSLLLAYRSGVFPWPLIGVEDLTWFSPPERTLLFLNECHISRSLIRKFKKTEYRFEIDRDVPRIIQACASAKNRSQGTGTWITKRMVDAYVHLHEAGYCHSVECYAEDRLVGGLYGVSIGGMFAGESMFHNEANGSKFALWYLVSYLKSQGVEWIDCQQMTPLLQSFGARNVPRAEFVRLLSAAIARPVELFADKQAIALHFLDS